MPRSAAEQTPRKNRMKAPWDEPLSAGVCSLEKNSEPALLSVALPAEDVEPDGEASWECRSSLARCMSCSLFGLSW